MPRNTQSFIIRIWYEETNNQATALARRGSVEHVSSKRRFFFQDLAQILRFIDEQTEAGTQAEIPRGQANP